VKNNSELNKENRQRSHRKKKKKEWKTLKHSIQSLISSPTTQLESGRAHIRDLNGGIPTRQESALPGTCVDRVGFEERHRHLAWSEKQEKKTQDKLTGSYYSNSNPNHHAKKQTNKQTKNTITK
jgi:hypothetical protein